MSLLTVSSRCRRSLLALSISCLLAGVTACAATGPTESVTAESAALDLFSSELRGAHMLVFSKTAGWRHDSIPAGIAALQKLAGQHGFTLEATEDASVFTDENLKRFNTLVFVNTTGDILDAQQEVAMERFIQAGGGFVGIHAAADTETGGEWFWYRRLVGGVFKSHPGEPDNVQHARLHVLQPEHPATRELPRSFEMTDEWYDYLELYPFRRDLLTVDENTYIGGLHGNYHPITWYHQFDGGRAFYTGLGHTSEMFSEPHFLALLTRGLRYATGGSPALDYSKSRPHSSELRVQPLQTALTQPRAFDFLPDGQMLVAEAGGVIRLLKGNNVSVAASLPVAKVAGEEGIKGLAVSPDFARDKLVYVSYLASDGNSGGRLVVSHFPWQDGKLDLAGEKLVIAIPLDDQCCHVGGELTFGQQGELFIATGDNSPLDADGYNLITKDGKNNAASALRTSANTADLRGKVLRIQPGTEGGYTIPEGNLYAASTTARPEIYATGVRNPSALSFDTTGGLLYVADRGPAASQDNPERGPRGMDEITRLDQPANLGWPFMLGNNAPYINFAATRNDRLRRFNPRLPENLLVDQGQKSEKILTPASSALVWYASDKNLLFPDFGSGERSILTAGVYQPPVSAPAASFPDYYQGKLMVLDAKRGWLQAVTIDDYSRVVKIEPLLPANSLPGATAARFSPDGQLYVLQQDGDQGKLVRIGN